MTQKPPQPSHAIEVDVDCQFIEEKSEPERNRYLFAYAVTIRNNGTAPAKLLTRHWLITDSNNKIQEVRGDGVIGQQPRLKPGEEHHYSSAAMIETSVGTMRGSYRMIDDEGVEFDAPIEQFVLSIPRTLH
ncbi:MAG: Co2+/Mg2+ efflux protein ApaG [Gammaproteobacteria bacterium]|nr:MAG: Co2+/Mg2+ efflux protein ApaG [Gammaproteobacteria bacterium]